MKTMFRPMVAFILVFMLLASMTGVAVSAEGDGKFAVTINGNLYEASAGDEIVYTARLEAYDGVESVSAHVKYNPEVLEWIEEPADVCLPNLTYPILTDSPDDGAVYFNAMSQGKAFDFSENQVLVTLRFKVTAEGDNKFSIYFTQLYGPNNEAYAIDGEFFNDSVIISQSASGLSEARHLKVSYKDEVCTAKAGEVVTFTVYAQAPEAISSVMAGIKFDNTRLELLDNTYEERYPNLFVDNDQYAGKSQQFAGSTINTDFHSDGPAVLAKLRFLVKGEGLTEFDVTYDFLSNTGVSYIGAEENDIELSATITVGDIEPADGFLSGDADENGKINVKDATAIQKHAAKVLVLSEYSQYSADVNADGKVNVKDATAVQKYLAKINTGYPIGEYLPLK